MTRQELGRAVLEINKICSDNNCPSCPFCLSCGDYDMCFFDSVLAYWEISPKDVEEMECKSND